MYKVLFVDDEALIREAICENTRWNELGYELVGACRNGREAIEQIQREGAPDLLLTDICMPYVDGIELTRYVYENCPDTKVMILSGYDEFEYAQMALRYHVMEYILKPVTAAELAKTLTATRERLDEERLKKTNLQRIKGEYISNLPLLRGRFLNNLLSGRLSEEEIRERLSIYHLDLTGNQFAAALVEGDDFEPFLKEAKEERNDLASFAVYNISNEIMEFHRCGITFQDAEERTVLLFGGDGEIEEKILKVTEEIRECLKTYLGIESTIGVGRAVRGFLDIPASFRDCKRALEFKFLLGGNQVIYAKELQEGRNDMVQAMPKLALEASAAIKSGDAGQVKGACREFFQAIRQSGLSKTRSIFSIQNMLLSLIGEMDAANLAGEVCRDEKELLDFVYSSEKLSEIEERFTAFCLELSGSFRNEKTNYCRRQAMLAMDYIEKNYGDSGVSLNSVCGYLAMSTSYFSSIFKAYTGETFVEALTKKRLEKAKELLSSTDKRSYEIAELVGYSDPHYFSSAFKKYTGMTPMEYARKTRGSL